MAMTTIDKMKDIFNGPKTLLYSKAITDLNKGTVDITPDVELPVTVDSLKATMDDPTINHYKVIGLAGDWATTAELGDFNVEFVVPSKAKDLLKIMFGEDAITELTKVLPALQVSLLSLRSSRSRVLSLSLTMRRKTSWLSQTSLSTLPCSGITLVLSLLRSSSLVL